MIFSFTLIFIAIEFFTKNYEIDMPVMDISSTSVGFLIVSLLLILALKFGIKQIKVNKPINRVDYNKTLNISVTGQIEYNDYRNLMLELTFKKPIFYIAFGVLLLLLSSSIANGVKITDQMSLFYLMSVVMGIFLISPFITLLQIKKLYNANKIFHEKLEYNLTNEFIRIKGETVDSTQKWSHFNQLKETRKFYLFYHGKVEATFLYKKMFNNMDLNEFNSFIQSLHIERK